jgi:hypothetical protein
MLHRRHDDSTPAALAAQHQQRAASKLDSDLHCEQKEGAGFGLPWLCNQVAQTWGLGLLFRSNNQGSVNEGRIGCSQAAAKPTRIRNRKHLRAHELESRKDNRRTKSKKQ